MINVTNIFLRQYGVKPERWDDFLSLWSQAATIRKRFGFEILFAFEDRANNVFTWALRHDGDLDAVIDQYYHDPERKKLNVIVECVNSHKETRVSEVPIRQTDIASNQLTTR